MKLSFHVYNRPNHRRPKLPPSPNFYHLSLCHSYIFFTLYITHSTYNGFTFSFSLVACGRNVNPPNGFSLGLTTGRSFSILRNLSVFPGGGLRASAAASRAFSSAVGARTPKVRWRFASWAWVRAKARLPTTARRYFSYSWENYNKFICNWRYEKWW